MSGRTFNTSWLIERRTSCGHSTMSLASHIGASVATVRAIEGGVNPDRYEYGLLARYAEALGCTIDDLFNEQASAASADEIAQVTATLVDAGHVVHVDVLAGALGWTPERCRDALLAAHDALAAVGLALAWQGDSGVVLVPAATVPTPTASIAEHTAAIAGLTNPQARVLAKLARTGRLSRSDDAVATKQMIDAGLVEYATGKTVSHVHHGTRAAVKLTSDASFNLCL